MTYYLGIIYVCFNVDCYFLQAPEVFVSLNDCVRELEEQIYYLNSEGYDPTGECFDFIIPGVEI